MALVDSERELAIGDPAPNFELKGTDENWYSLADFSEYEVLLIVFTCYHCPYAKAKFDTLNAITADYDDVAVIGINPNDTSQKPDDSFERMQELVADGTIHYDAYLRDESQSVAKAYGATCTPDPFLFRRDNGDFQLVYHGRLDDATAPEDEPSDTPGFEMRNAIDTTLRGEEISTEFKPSRGCSIKWT